MMSQTAIDNQGNHPHKATIYDVARKAGVGIGTVSRVLNQSQQVSEATRQKVQTAIQALEYAPDPIARSLNSGRTHTLGVIVPFFTRPFFTAVLEGVQTEIALRGYDLVLYNVIKREQRDTYFSKVPMRRRVDGLIILSLPPDDQEAAIFERMQVPVVLVDCYNPHLTSVVVDNVGGAYAAVSHLLKIGRKRIGFINGIIEGNFRFNQATDRRTGYEAALRDQQIPFDATLVTASAWNRQAGYQAALKLLDQPSVQRPDAIFTACDVQALGVLEAVKKSGLQVPQDVAVMGYDGIELAELLDLSTIQQPLLEMGALGVRLLLQQVESKSLETVQTIQLETKLISRATTKPNQPTVKTVA